MTLHRTILATAVPLLLVASLARSASADRQLHRRDGATPLVVERVAATEAGVQATVVSEGSILFLMDTLSTYVLSDFHVCQCTDHNCARDFSFLSS